MSNRTILLSSYNCNPFGVSESYTAFIWLTILLKEFNIILLTTDESEKFVLEYYRTELPGNLRIISFENRFPFKNRKVIREGVKLGYFYFSRRIRKYLLKNPSLIGSCDLFFQKSPESFRYFTSLTKFNKPVYIGPLSGGLKPPASFKTYFKKEPILHKLRNLDFLIIRLPIYKSQFKRLEKVLVCFDYLEDILPREYLKRKKLLLNSAINCNDYVPSSQLNSKVPTLLFVGRLTKYKGPELLVRALHHIREENFVLNIVGDGEEREYLEKLCRELNLCEKILFHGFKKPEEVKEFYSNASMFCFPSLTEAVGIVFYEAMASGLPIVTINNGGPKYICPDEGAIKIPLTTPEEVIQELSKNIKFLIDNPERREKMGTFNREYSVRHYDWKVLEKNILHFFNGEVEKFQR